jgi:hypothetical protein
MLRPPSGIAKSSGMMMSSWCGLTLTEAEDSTVSAMVLKPTQRPVKRDMAQPSMPMSRMSCTPAGFRIGIIAETNSSSEPCGRVEERHAWSSAASASTPPNFEVPAALPCLNTSPQRSTPGPLPYHMENTPSTLAPGNRPVCWVPQTMVAPRSSFRPGVNSMPEALRCFLAFHSSRSRPPSGEPR